MDASQVEVDLHRFDDLLETARCAPPGQAHPLLVQALGMPCPGSMPLGCLAAGCAWIGRA
jgi:hypothetical protein